MGCTLKSILFLFFASLLVIFACEPINSNHSKNKVSIKTLNQITNDNFQEIIDTNNLIGSILIYDSKKNQYHSNNFDRVKTGFLPASTFKIVNSIIALETRVIKDENHLFKWDGTPQNLKNWEADLTLAEAYKRSCVPCYQKVARKIGIDSMNFYLQKLNYGNQIVADSLLDLFWLVGDFQISQIQQIDFLHRLYNQKLPISERTYKIMQKVMLIEDNKNYKLSGKTGWAIREDNNIGWFIGFIQTPDNVYFIATNVTPKNELGFKHFAKLRLKVSLDAFEALRN